MSITILIKISGKTCGCLINHTTKPIKFYIANNTLNLKKGRVDKLKQ